MKRLFAFSALQHVVGPIFGTRYTAENGQMASGARWGGIKSALKAIQRPPQKNYPFQRQRAKLSLSLKIHNFARFLEAHICRTSETSPSSPT
ncbi:MAG: hypothetical protein IJ753_06925 [Bacteroidales bacterium]|nr:hypothetical protein [Bacteroidales bacterium]